MKNTHPKILHLEDNLPDAELVYIELIDSFPNMECHHAKNKEEFVKALKENTYQLILADYNVPRIVGNEALELALKYHPNTPVIFVSGGIDVEKAIEILRQGATDYVMKNNLMRLSMIVERALLEKQEKLDKEKIEANLTKLNYAIDNSNNEVFIFDTESLQFSYVNKGAINNLGYSFEAFKKMSPLDIKPKFTFNSFTKMLLPLKKGKVDKLQFETIHQRKDKTTYPVEVNLNRFTINGTSHFLALIVDLTKIKEEEQKRLKEIEVTNHFLQESQSVALLGYYTYNFNTQNWSASKTILDLMGFKSRERGSLQDWMNIIHPDDKHILTDSLTKRLKDENAVLDVTYRVILKNGKLHWIHHKAQKLEKDNKGNLMPTLGIIQDITEKRQLEHDFINAFIDAQESEKQSFGEELHDGISQILAAQGMYIDVLLRLNKDNDLIKHLNKVKEFNLNAATDTRNIAHGLMSKQLKEEGLIEAIKQICDDYNQSKNIKFKFQHSRLTNYDFSEDIKTNIFRISQEITTNIARYSMATKAFISLTKNKHGKLELIIKDNGVGFDLEKLMKENRGAGLKNIERRVTLLDGNLTVKTAPNKGVSYNIIVPLESTVKLRQNI